MKPFVNARPAVKMTAKSYYWILHTIQADVAVEATR
jgi:hypothetical protein